ncbi:MAG TPA: insulinase family protein, partial [Phenylobacterium sp.]|nr:insulinase family protein [Phenylobacterium sp.]
LLSSGGLKDMTQQELGASLRARGALALVSASEDAFSIGNTGPAGSPTPATELDLQMQLIAASLTEPGWRPDMWPTFVKLERDADRTADASPGPVFSHHAALMLHSGDMRWSYPSGATSATWKPQDAEAFMAPILATAPLELIVVGDVTVDQAIAATAKTLGALPPRREAPEPPGLRDVQFPAATPTPIVLRHKGRADQAMLDVSWPATDLFADTRGYAAASVLAEILRNRATDQFRVAEGKTYSPNAQAVFSRELPGYGRIAISVNLKPEDVDGVYQAIDAIAADLAAKPVAADEFARAAGPLIEAARRSLRINEVWVSYLSGAQTDPRRVAYLRNMLPQLQSLTPDDVQASARRWLVKDKSWRMTILPQTQTAAVAPPVS